MGMAAPPDGTLALRPRDRGRLDGASRKKTQRPGHCLRHTSYCVLCGTGEPGRINGASRELAILGCLALGSGHGASCIAGGAYGFFAFR